MEQRAGRCTAVCPGCFDVALVHDRQKDGSAKSGSTWNARYNHGNQKAAETTPKQYNKAHKQNRRWNAEQNIQNSGKDFIKLASNECHCRSENAAESEDQRCSKKTKAK